MIFSKNNDGRNQLEAKDPDTCPHCHKANVPTNRSVFFDIKLDELFSTWICSSHDCRKSFIASHKQKDGRYAFNRFLNGLPEGPIWPKPIQELKDAKNEDEESKFIKTYLQSLEAESLGLDEIAGMGFRKSIEYLVKDWAIQNNPDDKEKILGLWLSEIIKNYFQGDLKDILDRATWLGNDQSHYNKLFDEFNLTHLKELIELIMTDLDREYKKRHYIETIEKRK